MIKYQKISPVGVDKWIDRFQTQQQRELPDLFGVDEATCLFYGRTEKITVNDVVKNAVFVSGNKHEEVDIDKRYSFISYFVVEDAPDFTDAINNCTLSLNCHGDLSKIYSAVTHRADEEFRQDMVDFILKRIDVDEFLNIELLEILQPFHSFKINFIKHYQ